MFRVLKYTAKGHFQKLIRQGSRFRKWLQILHKLDAESESYRIDFQLASLRQILIHAWEKIPFWRKKLGECGLDPFNLKSIDDLKKLPFLTKHDVQRSLGLFVSEGARKFLLAKGLTSGTTGSPGVFYRDLRSINFENAMIWLIRSKAGMDVGCRLAWLRGDLVVPSSRKAPPFWVRSCSENKLAVSTYHLIPEYREEILQEMEAFQPTGAFAYPSAAYIVARWCGELNRSLPFANLHTSSETVLAEHREVIRSALKGQWVDHYSQAERVNFFASFDSNDYKVYTEYGVTELLPLGGGRYEVVGSTLHNYAMPLFRYRTGDIVESVEEDDLDRPLVRGLAGRIEDFVRLPDKRLIGRLDLVFKGLRNIIEGQIYQPQIEKIIIRVVPEPGYSKEDEAKLLHNARQRLGDEVELSIELLDRIPRTKQNKLKFVISDVIL